MLGVAIGIFSGAVGGINGPPAVAITSPTGGATVYAGTSTTISGTCSDANGTVTGVEVFLGATKLGDAVVTGGATWSLSWTPTDAQSGAGTLTAVATDNGGAQTTSAGVSITVWTPLVLTGTRVWAALANNAGTTDLANAGSLGGSMTAVASPTAHATRGVTVNGTSQYIHIDAGAMPTEWTVAFKAKRTAGARVCNLFGALAASGGIGINVGANWALIYEAAAAGSGSIAVDSNFHTFIVTYSSGAGTLYVDNVSGSTMTNTPYDSTKIILGAYPGGSVFMAGDIKDPCQWNRVLDSTERSNLHTFLAGR